MTEVHILYCRWAATVMAISSAILATEVNAQDANANEEGSSLELALGIELRNDDNIFQSAANEQASLITMLSPSLLARLVPSKHRFEFAYNGEIAKYAESSADDYDDHEFQVGAYLSLGYRSLLEFIGSYEDAHENRGSGLSEGFDPEFEQLLDEPDEFDRTEFLGRFTYGTKGAKGRLVFEMGQSELEYTNHRDRTRIFDRTETHGGTMF